MNANTAKTANTVGAPAIALANRPAQSATLRTPPANPAPLAFCPLCTVLGLRLRNHCYLLRPEPAYREILIA